MGITLIRAAPRDVRAVIAACLTPSLPAEVRLGGISLKTHQREAVARIEAAFAEFGGALLADATGLGKTYVALAIGRDARRPIVVAPASLRAMWTAAMQAAEMRMPFVSIESLGRRRPDRDEPASDADLVIVDEAHHARNPSTARYRALAKLTQRARVLLLTATPIHNGDADLGALLALFLGARSAALDRAAAMRCIIRRTADGSHTGVPIVESPRPLAIPDDASRMDAIVALPPPVPPSDGGDGGILLTYSLLRRWASSQGALVASLRRRLARATALLDALEAGRHPSSSELAAWAYADGSIQLAFPELTVATTLDVLSASRLATGIRDHAAAVRALLATLHSGANVDERRAEHLVAVRARHRGARIVAFTEYAETVLALFAQLRHAPRVAALTSTGARVAGGALSRGEALARFAPEAQGARPAGRAEEIDLLLTTDLLSEGVNLQDASVVIHLDLPWTPARMVQRTGRTARIGSRHDRVTVYAMQPPASAERIVRVEERLRTKLRSSARAIGVAGTIVPHLALHDIGAFEGSPPEWRERLAAAALPWLDRDSTGTANPIVAAVRAEGDGFLAVIDDDGARRVVAASGGVVSEAPEIVLRMMRNADGTEVDPDTTECDRAVRAIERWRIAHRDHRDVTLDGALRARARRSVVDRIAAIARRAPRHRRPEISALAACARRTASAHYGAGAERVLEELAAADMPDEAWLRAVGTFATIHAVAGPGSNAGGAGPGVVALLLLVAPGRAET